MYSVTNFGHSHPKIVAAATKAASECAVVNMVSIPPAPSHPFDTQQALNPVHDSTLIGLRFLDPLNQGPMEIC